jgi:hypothetical protein
VATSSGRFARLARTVAGFQLQLPQPSSINEISHPRVVAAGGLPRLGVSGSVSACVTRPASEIGHATRPAGCIGEFVRRAWLRFELAAGARLTWHLSGPSVRNGHCTDNGLHSQTTPTRKSPEQSSRRLM